MQNLRLPRHFTELEGIRGFLTLFVLFAHTYHAVAPVWPGLSILGAGSMDFFFCISGFLIGRNFYIRYQGKVSKAYFINRALRIWPLYFVAWPFATVCTYYVGWGFAEGEKVYYKFPEGPGLILPALFLQNVDYYINTKFEYLGLFQHSWSVAIEEQFYLLAPFAVIFLKKRSNMFLGLFVILLIALSVLVTHYGVDRWTFLGRYWGFLFGLYLAIIEMRAAKGDSLAGALNRASTYRALLLLSLILLMPFIVEWQFPSSVGFSVLNLSLFNHYFAFPLFAFSVIGLVVVKGMFRAISIFFRSALLQLVGRTSYSVYLLHVPIVYSLMPAVLDPLGLSPKWLLISAPIATLLLSYCTYHCIEMPFLRRKIYSKIPDTSKYSTINNAA